MDENKLITELEGWADRLNGGSYTEDVFKMCLTMVVKKIKDEYIHTCAIAPAPCKTENWRTTLMEDFMKVE